MGGNAPPAAACSHGNQPPARGAGAVPRGRCWRGQDRSVLPRARPRVGLGVLVGRGSPARAVPAALRSQPLGTALTGLAPGRTCTKGPHAAPGCGRLRLAAGLQTFLPVCTSTGTAVGRSEGARGEHRSLGMQHLPRRILLPALPCPSPSPSCPASPLPPLPAAPCRAVYEILLNLQRSPAACFPPS